MELTKVVCLSKHGRITLRFAYIYKKSYKSSQDIVILMVNNSTILELK